MDKIDKIESEVKRLLKEKPSFTGQITVEVHVKDGIVKDVYYTKRSKA